MTGVELIAAERLRQVEEEQWTAQHDMSHQYGELAIAAAALAVDGTDATIREPGGAKDEWGLVAKHGYRGTSPGHVRKLVIAGALIAAEIDRLLFPGAKRTR